MSLPTVRTLTLGMSDSHPISGQAFVQAQQKLQQAATQYAATGYEIQTLRLSTRPLLDDLSNWSPPAILAYAQEVQHILNDVGLEYCSLGTTMDARPDFTVQRLQLRAVILISTENLSATVSLSDATHGLRFEAALPIAQLILRLAHETPE